MSPERQLDWNAVVIGKGAAVPQKTILRGAANTVLAQTVVNDEPAFTKVNLATMVTGALDLATSITGVLPVANGGSGAGQIQLSYGTTIGVPNATSGNWFIVAVINAAAHAFPEPINATSGRMITLTVYNASGGAIATATFATPAYHVVGYVAPVNGFITSAQFISDGTNWYQVTPWITYFL